MERVIFSIILILFTLFLTLIVMKVIYFLRIPQLLEKLTIFITGVLFCLIAKLSRLPLVVNIVSMYRISGAIRWTIRLMLIILSYLLLYLFLRFSGLYTNGSSV